MTHSPEPWRRNPYSGPVPVFRMFSVTDASGETFILSTGGEDAIAAELNAERIVACVNALIGIPTSVLTEGGVTIKIVKSDKVIYGHSLPQ